MAKKAVVKTIKETINVFDDGTKVREIKTIEGENVAVEKQTTIDKINKKSSKERVLKSQTKITSYTYEDGTGLVEEKEFHFTPKTKEKKLDKHLVTTVK